MTAMAGVFALNVFRQLFPVNFDSTGASELLVHAHDLIAGLPDPALETGA
jgi:hypothetical protein